MSKQDLLFEIADRQHGYFTSEQAEECGFSRSNFHFKLRSGEWIKEQRGIYRLARYPVSERPELVLWTLWSRNKQGIPQGIWSHETALDIHELSDIMPAKMHMSVPIGFRKKIETPKILHLHFVNLIESNIETRQGFKVTTPLQTLIDVIDEGTVPREQIIQAIQEALQRGLISRQNLIQTPQLMSYKRHRPHLHPTN
ncbi:MAG TPA: type IV toxin-antitoxin system AbiEi family antitoxin domain-containing protein [Chlamydiales bacterium]|nr:type IV toxin-antitoxin system AbiEi family antitoxin domain-containing protein [Chlamydiales bacterium]